MHVISRAALVLIALVFAYVPAHGQPQTVVTQVQLGVREAGKTYPLALNAANADCNEPLDFRFTSNAAWLKLPADPVVRGVATGQSRPLQATIDLTNMSPGHYQASVEVECENCGWFIFQSCKIDKQQIVFFLDVAPAAAPQPPAAAIDPNDPRIPEPQRAKLKAAIGALDKANAKKKPCEEELDRLAAAAQAAREAADKAAKAAKEAADKAAQAEEAAKKAQAKADAADKEAKAAKEHAAKTEAAQGVNAKDTQEAKAAAAAAEAEAAKAGVDNQKAQQAARDAQAAAQKAAGAAAKAEADAKAAADAAGEAASKCARAQAEADQAQADKDAAEEKAKAAIPQPPPAARQLTPEEELERLKQEAERCAKECLDMARAQRIALEELTKVGLLHDQAALDNWTAEYNEIIDGVGDILGELGVPGTDYGAVLAKGALVAVAAGSKLAGAKEMQIRLTDPKATQDWLQGKGGGTPKVASPAEAKAVQQEMNRAMSGGLGQMTKDLAEKKAACEAAEKKYQDAKAKAGGKS